MALQTLMGAGDKQGIGFVPDLLLATSDVGSRRYVEGRCRQNEYNDWNIWEED